MSYSSAAPVQKADNKPGLRVDFPSKDERRAISRVFTEVDHVSHAWRCYEKAGETYTAALSDMNRASCDLFGEYVNVLKSIADDTCSVSENGTLHRMSAKQAIESNLPFIFATADTPKLQRWATYKVNTNSGLEVTFSYPWNPMLTGLDEDQSLVAELSNEMMHCFIFKKTKYSTKENSSNGVKAAGERASMEQEFMRHVNAIERIQRIESGNQKTWDLADIVHAAATVKKGTLSKHGGRIMFTDEAGTCKVSFSAPNAVYDGLGGLQCNKGLLQTPGLHQFQREKKLVNLVRPVCTDRPFCLTVEFSGFEGAQTRGFTVECHYNQLEKGLLIEDSLTTSYSKDEKKPLIMVQNGRACHNSLRINPSAFRQRNEKGRASSVNCKSISLERHVLMRVAQLQLENMKGDAKFAAEWKSAVPLSCVSRIVRVRDLNDYVWSAVDVDWSIRSKTYRIRTLHSLVFSHIHHGFASDKNGKQAFKKQTDGFVNNNKKQSYASKAGENKNAADSKKDGAVIHASKERQVTAWTKRTEEKKPAATKASGENKNTELAKNGGGKGTGQFKKDEASASKNIIRDSYASANHKKREQNQADPSLTVVDKDKGGWTVVGKKEGIRVQGTGPSDILKNKEKDAGKTAAVVDEIFSSKLQNLLTGNAIDAADRLFGW
jgi:hypothetical protein